LSQWIPPVQWIYPNKKLLEKNKVRAIIQKKYNKVRIKKMPKCGWGCEAGEFSCRFDWVQSGLIALQENLVIYNKLNILLSSVVTGFSRSSITMLDWNYGCGPPGSALTLKGNASKTSH
jgi:hypothetical protein